MKRILFIIICCILLQFSYGQTEKGRFTVSGKTDVRLLFAKSRADEGNTTALRAASNEYNVNTGLAYFIAHNLAIGLTGIYSYSYVKTPHNVETSWGETYTFYPETIFASAGVIPAVSYFFPVEGKLKPAISLGAGYTMLKERDSENLNPGNVSLKYSGLSLNAGAGVSYFINRNVSFDLGIQYSRNKLNDKINTKQTMKQNIYGALAGISLYF